MKKRLATVAVFGIFVLGGMLMVLQFIKPTGYVDFFLRRSRYNALVERVKTFGVAAGEAKYLRTNRDLDPAALRERRPDETIERGQGAGLIAVERTQDGQYLIAILTYDHGHAGVGGYIYHDAPLDHLPPNPLMGGEPDFPVKKLSEHWHTFADNSV